MKLDRFRRGNAYELCLRLGSGLVLHDIVHAIEGGQESRQIVPEATERSFKQTHASRINQLLAKLIEKYAHVHIWKRFAELASTQSTQSFRVLVEWIFRNWGRRVTRTACSDNSNADLGALRSNKFRVCGSGVTYGIYLPLDVPSIDAESKQE